MTVKTWLVENHGAEICLAVQEWGIKNNLRLFGISIGAMYIHRCDGPAEKAAESAAPRARGIFIDPAYKTMEIHTFDVKEKSGVISVIKTKKVKGFKWPIKFARTRGFQNDHLIPVKPLYWVLVDRGIILPFKSQLKSREWAALPFEDCEGIKPTEL